MADDDKQVGRRYRGDSPVLRTPEVAAAISKERASYAKKPGAMPIAAYFSVRGISSPIMQASMLAYTVVRDATAEDFDAIFEKH